MKLRTRSQPLRRAFMVAGVLSLTLGTIGIGGTAGAYGSTAGTDAAPTPVPETTPSQPSAEPTPSPTDPPASEPPVPPTTPAAPSPSSPAEQPVAPPPSTAPFAPPAAVDTPALGALLAPTFGRVYPTNPWVYNAQPGTRYLDVRQEHRGEVTRRHMGIDAQGGVRQPIFAVADGTVTGGTWGTTRDDGHGFGNFVRIAHADGYTTLYAHFAVAPLVNTGDRVTAGQVIGYMGGSQRGRLTALDRHLHFEVTKDGRHLDPLSFLTGAAPSTPPTPDAAEASAATPAPVVAGELHEIRAIGGAYVSISTGVMLGSDVFTAVSREGDSATILVSDNGALRKVSVIEGTWTTEDTGIALRATSMSGIVRDDGGIQLIAVEDGVLVSIVESAKGWIKTATGHSFSGTVSAARLPDGSLHAMLQQAGYLYHLRPSHDGLWDIVDTRLHVGDDVDAVYVDGDAPAAMALVDGEIHRITRGKSTWELVATGLPASGTVAAVYAGAGWPIALTAEGETLGVARVVNRTWARFTSPVTIPGPVDGVIIGGQPVLYSVG